MSTRTKPRTRTGPPPPLPLELRAWPPLKPLPARLVTHVPAGHQLIDGNGHTWQTITTRAGASPVPVTRAYDPAAGTTIALTTLHSTRGPVRFPDPAQVTLW